MNSSQKRSSLAVISLSILSIVMLAVGTLYLYHRVKLIKAEIEQIKSGIASIEAENDAIRNFQMIRSSRATDIERIRAFFIEKDRPLDFIETIESLGRSTKIKLLLDALPPTDKTASLTFRVIAEGSEKDVSRFLSLVELMPYEITIHSFAVNQTAELEPLTPETAKTQLSFTVEAKTK